MNINGRIDTGAPVISLCCENLPDIPKIPFSETAEETLERFVGLRTMVVAESLRRTGGTHFSCRDCANYQPSELTMNPFISYVNLSMYPAPCQCRCRYCSVYKDVQKFTPEAETAYNKLFDMLELGKESGVIEPNAAWQISTGEITIHPYRERIMSLVKGQRATFYTNAFLFNESIAQNLHDNPASAINLSIDAGTPKTWYEVKGVDNFDTVTTNLVQYYKSSARPGQISLKYIILPDINDNLEDFQSVIKIMKILEVPHLTLAFDVGKKYNYSTEEHTKLLGATGYLLAMCYKNNITNDMFLFSPQDRQQAMENAQELLQKQLV